MRTLITWALVGFLAAAIHAAERNIIPEDVWKKARATGLVSVLVLLNVPVKLLGQLTPQERIAQEDRINAAQDQLLAKLAGTQFTVIRRFKYAADLALRVGPDALAVLENSSLVEGVFEDKPLRPR